MARRTVTPCVFGSSGMILRSGYQKSCMRGNARATRAPPHCSSRSRIDRSRSGVWLAGQLFAAGEVELAAPKYWNALDPSNLPRNPQIWKASLRQLRSELPGIDVATREKNERLAFRFIGNTGDRADP